MGFNVNSLKNDEAKEIGGVWFDIGYGASIKVAKLRNKKHLAMVRKLTKLKEDILVPGTMLSDKDITDIQRDACAVTILLDWKGIEDDSTQPVVYSVEKSAEYLQIDDFYSIVLSKATQAEAYRLEKIGTIAGN